MHFFTQWKLYPNKRRKCKNQQTKNLRPLSPLLRHQPSLGPPHRAGTVDWSLSCQSSADCLTALPILYPGADLASYISCRGEQEALGLELKDPCLNLSSICFQLCHLVEPHHFSDLLLSSKKWDHSTSSRGLLGRWKWQDVYGRASETEEFSNHGVALSTQLLRNFQWLLYSSWDRLDHWILRYW